MIAVNAVGLSFAVALARWLVARDLGGAELRRLGLAIERAVQSFVWGQVKATLAGLLVVSALVFACYGFVPGQAVGRLDAGLWGLLGVWLGGAGGILNASIASHIAHKCSARSVTAARLSLDHATSVLMRGGGVVGLLAETVSALTLVTFAMLVMGLRGGLQPGADPELIQGATALLPSLTLGAVTVGLLLQRTGAVFHTAGDVGGELATDRAAQLDASDVRNPALVAQLVGDHVGQVTGRSAVTYVAASATQVVMLVIGASAFAANRAAVPGALGLMVLPLLVRAFGVVASSIGLMVVRTTESGGLSRAFLRGQLVVWWVLLAGLLGSCYWLLGAKGWWIAAAGGLGLVGLVLVSQLLALGAGWQRAGGRGQSEALRDGAGSLTIYGIGSALTSTLLPIGLFSAALVGAHWLGARSALEEAGALALTVAAAAMLGPGPFQSAITHFAVLSRNARGVAELSRAPRSADAERRAEALQAAAIATSSGASGYLLIASTSGVLLVVSAAPSIAGLTTPLSITHPAAFTAALLGVAAALSYAGASMDRAGRAASLLGKEVERQLKAPQASGGALRDFTPIYKTCIELAGRVALERSSRALLHGLALPLALALALALGYRQQAGVAIAALLTFTVAGAGTAIVLALAGDRARDALAAVKRSVAGRASPSRTGALGASAVADVLGNVGGPAAHLFMLAAAAAVLAAAPYLYG
ncbi:MAG: sodium/proton-translocating pyrophosphatase [Polyangiaceae bacterium]|nr:sodium/proton-translocating pyrophosphatase [Polyangiaceae bacterium]MCW5790868.1 sodium/proton-translocating pyrophosphatase [Polyangiaceae bacterium]